MSASSAKSPAKPLNLLGVLWAVAAGGYLVYAWISFTGLFRWAAEWQVAQFGSYEVKLTLLGLFILLMLPAGAPTEDTLDTGERFIERPTIPFLRPDRPVTSSGISSEVVDAIGKTLTIARARTSPRADLVKQILGSLEAIATEGSASFATAVLSARELYGVRTVDETGIQPLFDALDQARIITASSVHQISVSDALRAKVLRAISSAHQRLVSAVTGLVLEAVAPYTEKLRNAQANTADLRAKVASLEGKRAELANKFAENIDQSLPWEKRGVTEW